MRTNKAIGIIYLSGLTTYKPIYLQPIYLSSYPEELNVIWLYNELLMTKLLFWAVRETLLELLGDIKYLGAKPGIIAALHTWGQTLALHPHIHCLVTGGGLTALGKWIGVNNGFLLPARVVMALFRDKLIWALRQAYNNGEIILPPNGMRPQQFLNLLNKLKFKKKKWNVRIMERYNHGEGVATYLARYLRGGAIGNSRLLAYNGKKVTFSYYWTLDKLLRGNCYTYKK